jgi:hypothetical protein
VTVRIAVALPVVVGLKDTVAVQTSPAARGDGQALVGTNAAAPGPVMVKPSVPVVAAPPFRMVMLAGAEVVFTNKVPKLTELGDAVN